MVEPLNTKPSEHARIWLEPAGDPDRCWCSENQWGDEGVEYVLASPSLPVADGGDLAERLAYRVGNPSAWPEGFDQKASDLFRSAVALISSQKQQISALMNERTSLIETKREQLAQAQVDTTRAQWRAVNAESRVLSLEEEVKRLREALKSFVNVRDQHPESVKLINGSLDGFTIIEVKVTKDQFLAAHAALKESQS